MGLMKVGNNQIEYMVERFLSWKLPKTLNPDGGISFTLSEFANKHNHPWPTGTNFLDAFQATEMVRHMVEELPQSTDYTDCFEQLGVKSLPELVEKYERQIAALERQKDELAEAFTMACNDGWADGPSAATMYLTRARIALENRKGT